MRDFPLVAVVTPSYNGMPYLESTLRSVQQQTYPNVVHVVLDNASTDDSAAVISKYSGGRVPIFSERNATLISQMDNWNKAMSLVPADARYVNVLCADDLLRKDAIERLVECAESDPRVDFVTARDVYDGRLMTHGLDCEKRIYNGREFARLCFLGVSNWQPWPHVFFRSSPQRLQRPFHAERYPGADSDFVFRELLSGQVGVINEPLFYTRAGAVTLSEGGGASYVFPVFERLLLYGRNVLSEEEFERQYRWELNRVMRRIGLYRWCNPKKANDMLSKLADYRIEVSNAQVTLAMATWPLYKASSASNDFIQRLRKPVEFFPESSFLADS